MGNQESKPNPTQQSGGSSAQPPSSHATIYHGVERGKSVRRRESIHAGAGIPGGKATASPSASSSLTSATATPNPTLGSAKDILKKAAPLQTTAQSPNTSTPQLKPADTTPPVAMGNTSSTTKAIPIATPEKATAKEDVAGRRSPLPRPINVPSHGPPPGSEEKTPLSPILSNASAFVEGSFQFHSPSQFANPPRLPLPIDSEQLAPGSPIISPQDISAPIGAIEGDLILPRKSSVLSSTTVDDDDIGDDATTLNGGLLPTIPTIFEWREGGEKVYVTGTFAGWDKKYRLHKDGPSKHEGALSCWANLLPGTHHVRFIVDGDSKLSKFMPTAVDFTNFLVNYVEVAAPGPGVVKEESQPLKQLPAIAQPAEPLAASELPGEVHPPQVLPASEPMAHRPKEDATPKVAPTKPAKPSTDTLSSGKVPKSAPIAVFPEKKYHTEIPKWLEDIEAEDTEPCFIRASNVMSTLPAPPSLPMFLNKSVLNGSTPMKDDASVLNMPNHTVLNHLATSSIKNKVLATSATTRYKRKVGTGDTTATLEKLAADGGKFLTTIMYKPTSG